MINSDILYYAEEVDNLMTKMSLEAPAVRKTIDSEQNMQLRLAYDRMAEASALPHRAAGE